VLIGFSSSATFAPLVADISHWFDRRRGIAVAIAASGNYLAGAIWPTIIQMLIHDHGWRGHLLGRRRPVLRGDDPAGADLAPQAAPRSR
jgi:MFS family permease